MKVTKCPLCGSKESTDFAIITSHSPAVERNWRGCGGCDLVYVSERETQKELLEYYRDEYRGVAEEGSPFGRRENRARYLRAVADEFQPITISHLDIGCFTGELINKINAPIQVGVDPDMKAPDFVDCKVHTSIYNLPEGDTFDLITMSHVLEHLGNPLKDLKHIRKFMKASEGIMIVEVPNLPGEKSALAYPHIVAFSQVTLQRFLEGAGYYVMEIQTRTPSIHGRVFKLEEEELEAGEFQLGVVEAPPSYLIAIATKHEMPILTEVRERWYRRVHLD